MFRSDLLIWVSVCVKDPWSKVVEYFAPRHAFPSGVTRGVPRDGPESATSNQLRPREWSESCWQISAKSWRNSQMSQCNIYISGRETNGGDAGTLWVPELPVIGHTEWTMMLKHEGLSFKVYLFARIVSKMFQFTICSWPSSAFVLVWIRYAFTYTADATCY